MRKPILILLAAAGLISTSVVGAIVLLLLSLDTADQERRAALQTVQWQDLPYMAGKPTNKRGRILAVVTSIDTLGTTGRPTGYELTELARAYAVFTANGFEVDVASTKGGAAPAVIDGEDMGAFDYAFLNDPIAQTRLKHTINLASVDPSRYQAVFFVGGKGAMFDFPTDPRAKALVSAFHREQKVISAVCHGAAAFLGVRTAGGKPLVQDKKVSGFTNQEELLLMPDARTIFPFLLEDQLTDEGARFVEGAPYLEQIAIDGRLITGQNPWSVWPVAEAVVAALGYNPKPRIRTAEENSVQLLKVYKEAGYAAAKRALVEERKTHRPLLIALHGLIALKELDVTKSIALFRLASAVQDRSA